MERDEREDKFQRIDTSSTESDILSCLDGYRTKQIKKAWTEAKNQRSDFWPLLHTMRWIEELSWSDSDQAQDEAKKIAVKLRLKNNLRPQDVSIYAELLELGLLDEEATSTLTDLVDEMIDKEPILGYKIDQLWKVRFTFGNTRMKKHLAKLHEHLENFGQEDKVDTDDQKLKPKYLRNLSILSREKDEPEINRWLDSYAKKLLSDNGNDFDASEYIHIIYLLEDVSKNPTTAIDLIKAKIAEKENKLREATQQHLRDKGILIFPASTDKTQILTEAINSDDKSTPETEKLKDFIDHLREELVSIYLGTGEVEPAIEETLSMYNYLWSLYGLELLQDYALHLQNPSLLRSIEKRFKEHWEKRDINHINLESGYIASMKFTKNLEDLYLKLPDVRRTIQKNCARNLVKLTEKDEPGSERYEFTKKALEYMLKDAQKHTPNRNDQIKIDALSTLLYWKTHNSQAKKSHQKSSP